MSRRLAPWLAFFAAVLVYLPALRNGFISWDDRVILVENPYFRGLGWDNVRWMFMNFATGKYQPVSWLSFGLDFTLWGMNPAGYHLTALLLHAADAALVCLVALRLLGGNPAAALFAALFWALHPLRVEAVAWATDRGDPLGALFYLAATLWYLDGRIALSCAAYALGLASKATGITWPALLLVLDFYPLGRWTEKNRIKLLVEKIPYAALALAFSLVGFYGQSTTRALVPLERVGLGERVAQALYAPVFYLAKTLAPLSLSPLYTLSPRMTPAPFVLSALAVGLIVWLLHRKRRAWPWAAAAGAAFALALLPVCGLVKLGLAIASDRYSYLPAIPLALLGGAALLKAPRSSRWAAALVLALLAAATTRQISFWHDSESFWTRAVGVDPDCYVCHKNLGDALAVAGRDEEALEHRRLSRILLAKARHDAGIAYYEAGDYDRAIIRFSEALEAVPAVPETENDLGLCLMRLGRGSEAALHFQAATEAKPDFVEARVNWAAALASRGITTQARLQLRKALELDPGNERALEALRSLGAK